jgi:adenosylcobyric acid synthase
LPYSTVFQPSKQYRHQSYTLGSLTGYWSALSGLRFHGYEIRHGTTVPDASLEAPVARRAALAADGGWQRGQTLVLYPHGLFESGSVLHALFGGNTPTLDDTLEGLADFVDAHFAKRTLMRLIEAP